MFNITLIIWYKTIFMSALFILPMHYTSKLKKSKLCLRINLNYIDNFNLLLRYLHVS